MRFGEDPARAGRTSAKWREFAEGVVPLGIAEMDFAVAPVIAAALRDAIERSDLGYAWPVPELGQALAQFARDRWSWSVEPTRVQAATDAGVAIVELLRAMCRPGDAVVINPPVYTPFHAWVPEAGARLIEVPLLRVQDGYRLDLERLERAFAERPAVYLLCSPHNPVGRVHSRGELEAVVELARRYDVKVISDEVHAPLVLGGEGFTPLLTLRHADAIAVSVMSASKAFNIAGLKCAQVIAGSAQMAARFSRFPPETNWRVGHLGVIASATAYRLGGPWLDDLVAELVRRREELGVLLSTLLPAVDWVPPDASYLAWLDFSTLGDGEEIRQRFIERARVGLNLGTAYGSAWSDHLRLNFATSSGVLERAVRAMAAALSAS